MKLAENNDIVTSRNYSKRNGKWSDAIMVIEKVIDAVVCDRVPCKQALSWSVACGGCIGRLSGTTSKEGSWEGWAEGS